MNVAHNAGSSYQELRRGSSFRVAWVRRASASQTESVLTLPDGTVDLIWSDGRLLVSGPNRFAQREGIEPFSTIAGVRFARGAASAWLGVDMRELVGRRVPLGDIVGRRRAEGTEVLLRALVDPASVSDVKEQSLLGCADEAGGHFASAVIGAIEAATAEEAILPAIVRATGLSERTLRRRCDQIFGYGPRTLSRILRLQRLITFLRTEKKVTLAMAAVAGGFADQPHMTREVRSLTTLSPKGLVALGE